MEYQWKSDEKELQMRELSCKMKAVEEEYDWTEEEYRSPKMDMKQIIRFSEMKQLLQEAVEVVWKFREVSINLS